MMELGLTLIGIALINLLIALFSDGRHRLNYSLFKGTSLAKVLEIRPFTGDDSRSSVEQLQSDGTWEPFRETQDRSVQLPPYGFLLFDQGKPLVRFAWQAEGHSWRGNYRYLYRKPLWQAGETVELHYLPGKPWVYEVSNPRLTRQILLKAAVSAVLILAGILTMHMAGQSIVRKDTADNRIHARDRMWEAYTARYQPDLTDFVPEHGEDYEIVWDDSGMEAHIRFLLEKPEGAIRHSDVWDIRYLSLNASAKISGRIGTADSYSLNPADEDASVRQLYDGTKFPNIVSISDLRHFDSLQVLETGFPAAGTAITDLTGLASCRNLRIVTLSNAGADALAPLADMPWLEVLQLEVSGTLNAEPLGAVTGLRELRLTAGDISSLEPLTALPELQYLYLSAKIPDYAPLSETTLSYLVLRYVGGTQDYTPLTHIPNLLYLDVSHMKQMTPELITAIIEGNPGLRYLDISATPAAKRSGELPDENLLAVYDYL